MTSSVVAPNLSLFVYLRSMVILKEDLVARENLSRRSLFLDDRKRIKRKKVYTT